MVELAKSNSKMFPITETSKNKAFGSISENYPKYRSIPVDGNSFYLAVALSALENYILQGKSHLIKVMALQFNELSAVKVDRNKKFEPLKVLAFLISIAIMVDRKETKNAHATMVKAMMEGTDFATALVFYMRAATRIYCEKLIAANQSVDDKLTSLIGCFPDYYLSDGCLLLNR